MRKIEHFEAMLQQRSCGGSHSYPSEDWYCATAYERTQECQCDVLVFKEACWPGLIPAVSAALLRNGITEVCMACPTTNLLDRLEAFQAEGWYVYGLRRVPTDAWGGNKRSYAPGLMMLHSATPFGPRQFSVSTPAGELRVWANPQDGGGPDDFPSVFIDLRKGDYEDDYEQVAHISCDNGQKKLTCEVFPTADIVLCRKSPVDTVRTADTD